MKITFIQYLLILLVSAIAGVGSVVDNAQTHRAIIVSPLIGLILGDLTTGVIIGGTIEMISLGWMNIGGAHAPDAALAGIISTIIVIAGGQEIGAGIALAIPVAAAGTILTILARTATVGIQHSADRSIETGELKRIDHLHLGALIFQVLRVAIPVSLVVFTVGTDAVQNFLNAIPEVITDGLNVGGGMIVVVGYAMVINMMKTKELMPFLFLGFTIAAFADYNLIGLGLLGLIFALIYVELHPDFQQKSNQVTSGNNLDDEL